jgi:hypothetical protein
VIVGILVIAASVLANYYLAIDATTSAGLIGLSIACVAFIVPVSVYVPMMRVTYPKALLISAMRYTFALAAAAVALLLLVCLVALGNLLNHR